MQPRRRNGSAVAAVRYSAQQESLAGFLNREMATIFSASAIVGNTCNRSMRLRLNYTHVI